MRSTLIRLLVLSRSHNHIPDRRSLSTISNNPRITYLVNSNRNHHTNTIHKSRNNTYRIKGDNPCHRPFHPNSRKHNQPNTDNRLANHDKYLN